jgi:hypothetical protein
MILRSEAVVGAVVIGLGASLIMDLWNLFLRRAFGIPSLNYCLLGRWLCHMPRGTFRHANIAAAPRSSGECAVGWVAHYTIGVVFAFGFIALMSEAWLARPTLLPALLYGIATVMIPFFVMQPSLGLGIAAAKAARPRQARLKSMATHTVFGIGMYVWALAVGPLLTATRI